MKKIFMIIMILFVLYIGSASAVDWKVTNQVTIAWDAPTTFTDGTPLVSSVIIRYKVYLSNAITDPDKSNPVLLGETDQLEYTVTLNVEGKYFAGVSSARYDDSGQQLNESDINWSDTNGIWTPAPFGLAHYLLVGPPANLR